MWFVRVWMPLAVAVTLMCGLLYGVVQQNYRQSLNDPQIQTAENIAAQLSGGATISTVLPKQEINIGTSLSQWVAVYDATGTPIASSGLLNGAMPKPPQGVFTDLKAGVSKGMGTDAPFDPDNIADTGENRLTWQPETGVRQAIVVVMAGNRFVVAGRNMREVENRIWQLETIIGFGWIFTLVATLIAVWLGSNAQDFITFVRE